MCIINAAHNLNCQLKFIRFHILLLLALVASIIKGIGSIYASRSPRLLNSHDRLPSMKSRLLSAKSG